MQERNRDAGNALNES
jgi:hypothetical protein